MTASSDGFTVAAFQGEPRKAVVMCHSFQRFSFTGYARIVLTLAALACARQYPLLCVATYFLA